MGFPSNDNYFLTHLFTSMVGVVEDNIASTRRNDVCLLEMKRFKFYRKHTKSKQKEMLRFLQAI